MPIISVTAGQTGLVGVLPSVAYINTSDTLAAVSTAGYLNKEVANGLQFSLPCIAAVTTQASPSSAPVVSWFQVVHVAPNWSLIQPSGDSVLLPSGDIFVGNSLGIATGVAMSGDATISNTGVLTIAAGAITNAKVSATAAIAFTKLAALTSGNILVGNVSNVATSVAMSGAATLSNAGVLALTAGSVALANLAAGITPAAIVKYFGTSAYAGGSASTTITVTGMLNTDVPFVQLQGSTTAVDVQKVTPSSNTITILMSGDPGAATTFSYQVLRAPS